MILVDTSVLIDYFKGKDNEKTALFAKLLQQKTPFGISAYTYQELLQGARDKNEFDKLKQYLENQHIFFLPAELSTYETAASMYFELRRRGKTIRSIIDILIALTALHHGLRLLHRDKDFDQITDVFKELALH